MELKVKYLKVGVTKLKKISQGDWIDLYASETVHLVKGEFKTIPLGVAIQLPVGYEALIGPRSSTFKKWGVLQVNSPGVVDESYCGDNDQWLFAALAMRDTAIEAGDKICQFRIEKKMEHLDIIEVSELGNKNRGGFGSTGTK